MTTENATQVAPAPAPSVEMPRTPTVVNTEYAKNLTHKELSYPTEDKLQGKIDDALKLPVWRIHVKRKDAKPVPLNQITFKGIDASHQIPSVDADELQQTILGICYEDVHKRDEKATYLIVFNLRTAAKGDPARLECSIALSPEHYPREESRSRSDDRDHYDRRDDDRHEHEHEREREEDAYRAQRERDRLERIRHYTDRSRGDFLEAYSPYSDTSRARREADWRSSVLGEQWSSSPTPHDPHDPRFAGSGTLQGRHRQLFSPDMEMRFDPNQLPPHVQQDYMQAVMPFHMLNSAMALSMKGMAASFDMIVSANREQAAQHALQMGAVYEREKQLMAFPMEFLRIEAQQKQHQAELLQNSHDQFVDTLRMRSEMNNRELGYQQQNLHNQYALAENQRQMQEQTEKHQQEKNETWRRDLVRGIAPMALQGLGLFLDYFGQQKAGAAARMSGNVVEGIFNTIEQQEQQGQPGPGQPGQPGQPPPQGWSGGPPPQGPMSMGVPHGQQPGPPRAPTSPPGAQVVDVSPNSPIPRRTLRLVDFASSQDIQTQPLRSLCRMADAAFSQSDRQRLRQVLTNDEVQQLEHALRGQTDSECMNNLGMFMFTVARDEERKQRMLAMFTPGQNQLLNMIGDVMQGKVRQLDPNYQVEIRPPRSRMRTVIRQSTQRPTPPGQPGQPPRVPAPAPSRAPVPPSDLDSSAVPQSKARVPGPPPELEDSSVEVPHPSAEVAPGVDPGIPRPSAAPSGDIPRPSVPPDDTAPEVSSQPPPEGTPAVPDVHATLAAIQAQLTSMQAETAQMRAELDENKATSKPSTKPRRAKSKAPRSKTTKKTGHSRKKKGSKKASAPAN